jgi:hypothetical protein
MDNVGEIIEHKAATQAGRIHQSSRYRRDKQQYARKAVEQEAWSGH